MTKIGRLITNSKTRQRLCASLKSLGERHKFLKANPLYRSVGPLYTKMRIAMGDIVLKPDANAVAFFTENTERTNAVVNLLADEQSKKEYRGMIQFRQSHNEKDFPLCKRKTPQYFMEKLKLGSDEIFLDCGAFTGDTLDVFLKHCPDYQQILAFEPDRKNFKELEKKYGSFPKITLINAGVYDRDGTVQFLETGNVASKIGVGQAGGTSISVRAIDNLGLSRVSFIKMDVEGAELNALKGAEKTILRDQPKLAVCIYHSHEDMIRIPEYIHTLIPEYQLYVRHYNLYPSQSETVLYALMP